MKIKNKFSAWRRSRLLNNIFIFYCLLFVTFSVQFATVPYLARILKPEIWGLYGFSQVFGNFLSSIVRYGLNMSATRKVAFHRYDDEKLEDILSGVLGSQIILIFLVIILALIVQCYVPYLKNNNKLFWSCIFWAVFGALNLIWYFQGIEQIKKIAAAEISIRIFSLLLIFHFIKSPEDVWKVFFIRGTSFFFLFVIGLYFIYQKLHFHLPAKAVIRETFSEGWSFFLLGGVRLVNTQINIFILNFFAPIQSVGYYTGASKISSVFSRLYLPLTRAIYPRISYLVKNSRSKAAKMILLLLPLLVLCGFGAFLFIYFGAKFIISFVLGPGYESAIPVLKVFALLPIITAVKIALGTQWMLPLGFERVYTVIIFLSVIINICFSLILAPHYSHYGVAWAYVSAELFWVAGIILFITLRKVDPFSAVFKVENGIGKA